MLPFFVVDRQVNLHILHRYFVEHEDIGFGLMTHAQTTANFQSMYSSFPEMLSLEVAAEKIACRGGMRFQNEARSQSHQNG